MQPIGVYLNDNLNFSTQSVASKFEYKMKKKDTSVYQSVAKFISLCFFFNQWIVCFRYFTVYMHFMWVDFVLLLYILPVVVFTPLGGS